MTEPGLEQGKGAPGPTEGLETLCADSKEPGQGKSLKMGMREKEWIISSNAHRALLGSYFDLTLPLVQAVNFYKVNKM